MVFVVAVSTCMQQCDHLSEESRKVKNLTTIRESTESQESVGKLLSGKLFIANFSFIDEGTVACLLWPVLKIELLI